MDEPKRPTPVRRQLSLTQAVLVKLIPIGLVLNLGMLTSSADVLLEYSVSHVNFVHWAVRMPNSDKLCNNFRAARTNECLDFSLSLLAVFDSIRICCGKSISGTFGFTGTDCWNSELFIPYIKKAWPQSAHTASFIKSY